MDQETKEEKQENALLSLSSSPSHEFSFTNSLHSQNQTKLSLSNIDLSPADEIFFHGHLLPLHLLPHRPQSPPRASTNSLDNVTLPITQQLHDESPTIPNNKGNNTKSTTFKSKSFSLFTLPKWRKGCEVIDKEENGRCKKRPKFDVSNFVKKYTRALLSFKGRRSSSAQFYHHQSYSYSDNLSSRLGGKRELRGRFSAPASMRTSPTNSGLIAAKESVASNTCTSDTSMEELQAAIQAAIAHCKNSVSIEDTLKCQ